MNIKNTVVVAVAAILCTGVCLARPGGPGPGGPGGGRPGGPGFRQPPPPRHGAPHHRPNDGFWGRGGRNFWPGFVGGVVGGVVSRAVVEPAPVIVTTPTVVTTPAVVTTPVVVQPTVVTPVTQVQNVWVEGRYIDQVQANGTVVRIWQPGHYEQRTVVVQ